MPQVVVVVGGRVTHGSVRAPRADARRRTRRGASARARARGSRATLTDAPPSRRGGGRVPDVEGDARRTWRGTPSTVAHGCALPPLRIPRTRVLYRRQQGRGLRGMRAQTPHAEEGLCARACTGVAGHGSPPLHFQRIILIVWDIVVGFVTRKITVVMVGAAGAAGAAAAAAGAAAAAARTCNWISSTSSRLCV